MRSHSLFLGKKRNRIVFFVTVLCCLVLCCLLSSHKFAGIVSLITLFVAEIVFAIETPRFIFKYIFFFFGSIANIIGCFVCEYGSFYLVELSEYTHYVGALPTLIIAQLSFTFALYEFENRHIKTTKITNGEKKIDEKRLSLLNCFVLVLYILLFVHVFPHPAFGLNVDRMTYSSIGYNSGIWNYLSKWAQFFIVIPIGCIAYTHKRKYKILGATTLAVYCLYYFWLGNKFGSFFSLFCVFCMLNFSRLDIKERTLKRIFLIVMGLIIALVLSAAFIFTKYQSGGTSIYTYLQNRLAQQGQLFWRTYEVSKNQLHLSSIGDEITGQFTQMGNAESLVGARFGVYNIMYLCAPKQKVDAFILYGSRYTEAGYASALYYCGILGCIIFAILFAKIIVTVTNSIIKQTKTNNLVGMILTVRMYFVTCTALSMFLFGDYFTGTSFLTYLWAVYSKAGKRIVFRHRSGRMDSKVLSNIERVIKY